MKYVWIVNFLFFTQLSWSAREDVSDKAGWAYVGIVSSNQWVEQYFDVKFPESGIIPNEDGKLEITYSESKEVESFGNVHLRKGHIQWVDGSWVNQDIIGLICKGQMIKIISLKRVARIAPEDGHEEGGLDGFWWAEVSGDVGSKCE